MNAIITALIGGVCVAIPSIITAIANIKRNNELLKYRIDELTEMAEKHESFTSKIAVVEQNVKEINSRIEALEKK